MNAPIRCPTHSNAQTPELEEWCLHNGRSIRSSARGCGVTPLPGTVFPERESCAPEAPESPMTMCGRASDLRRLLKRQLRSSVNRWRESCSWAKRRGPRISAIRCWAVPASA
jgi:hypothetical protein